jgi:aminoglycoside 3-N-acetyltransferase
MNVVTLDECVTRFSEAGIASGDTVVVHASLKAIGWISGGANTVLDALVKVVGPQGTLVVPAQYTANLDPAFLEGPVDPRVASVLRQSHPPFRGKATHLPTMGALTNVVMLDERSKVSDHPTMAVAALGKHAKWITSEHPLSPAFGPSSPYAKAIQLNAKALLIGVDTCSLSALHTVQAQLNILPWCIHSMTIGSVEAPVRSHVLDYAYTTIGFNAITESYALQHPIRSTQLGHAPLVSFDLSSFIPFAKSWMERMETT